MKNSKQLAFVIPVRTLGEGKTRLSGWFDPAQRAELAAAMLQDLLAAVAASRCGARCVVATADPVVARIARSRGAEAALQASDHGVGPAIDAACRQCLEAGDTCIALHADLPFASAGELAMLAQAAREHEVVIVPDRHREGTNALAFRWPRGFPFRWGSRSFSQHVVSAHSWGLPPQVLELPTLMHDIDVPDDLFHGIASERVWCDRSRAAGLLRLAASAPQMLPTW